jgi:hypothetical protein
VDISEIPAVIPELNFLQLAQQMKLILCLFSLFRRAFQFTIYNGPTNALVCNKTLIQMSHTKTIKITPKYFDHQTIII